MLDKNNSILWDEYRNLKNNGVLENENLKLFMLGLSICVTIDKFLEQHPGFDGRNELLAIKGITNNKNEQCQDLAAAYNNNIETAMGLVRPKLKEVLKDNDVDPTALILYTVTGMFCQISPEEANEQRHILLTLLQYESMGIDVSDCKNLWSFIADTLEFEKEYDENQVDGKNVTPISFKAKHETKGFLTEEAQKTVAEFVFMNIRNMDPQWMNLFSENPRLASSVISLKSGFTEDLWKLYAGKENEDANFEPFQQFRSEILTDNYKALDDIILYTEKQIATQGSSFIRCLTTADLLCMKSCDRHLDKDSQKILDVCIEDLENTNSFPEGVTLEDVLYSFHKEMHLPELYFMFFTVFYMADYGKFRTIAKSTFDRYNGTASNKAVPAASAEPRESQPQGKHTQDSAPQKKAPQRQSSASVVTPDTPPLTRSSDISSTKAQQSTNIPKQLQTAATTRPETREDSAPPAKATALQKNARANEKSQNMVSTLVQMNKTANLLNIAHLVVAALLLLGMFTWNGSDFILFAIIETGVRAVSCYFASQKYSAVWETGKFQSSIAVTTPGVIGFLACFLGCLFKGHFGFAIILLAIREAIVFMLIKKSISAVR